MDIGNSKPGQTPLWPVSRSPLWPRRQPAKTNMTGAVSLTRNITINSVQISDDSDCYVIAELGHNHQGQVETAKALIKAAHDCGVQAVKLQKRDNRSLYT